ncbi:TBP domain superfamily [Sesbania bispinosa]|nr:TBP domain superfamily [Sesbania bispinosa]
MTHPMSVTNCNIDMESTGEVEDDGVEDEYQLEDLEVVSADYVLKVRVSNFRNAWESMGPDCERVDEHGLCPRESLAEVVNIVINLLGLQPCEWLHKVLNL